MEEENVKKSSALGIVGFVLSFFMPLISLIISIIAVSNAKKENSSKGFATAGIVISSIILVLRVLVIVGFILFGFNVSTKGIDFLKKGYSDMCKEAQVCESSFGNLYYCSYKKNGFSYNITCPKDMIPSTAKIDEEAYDKEMVESAASKYYLNIYDGVIESIESELDDGNIVITINDEFEIKVNLDTLKGTDESGFIVDLNKYTPEA